MTVIVSGTYYVLYSKLNLSNVSLNYVAFIAILKATVDSLPQILKIKKANIYVKTVNSLQTNECIS